MLTPPQRSFRRAFIMSPPPAEQHRVSRFISRVATRSQTGTPNDRAIWTQSAGTTIDAAWWKELVDQSADGRKRGGGAPPPAAVRAHEASYRRCCGKCTRVSSSYRCCDGKCAQVSSCHRHRCGGVSRSVLAISTSGSFFGPCRRIEPPPSIRPPRSKTWTPNDLAIRTQSAGTPGESREPCRFYRRCDGKLERGSSCHRHQRSNIECRIS